MLILAERVLLVIFEIVFGATDFFSSFCRLYPVIQMVSPDGEIILGGFRGRGRGMGRGRGDGLDLEDRGCARGHSIHWKKES